MHGDLSLGKSNLCEIDPKIMQNHLVSMSHGDTREDIHWRLRFIICHSVFLWLLTLHAVHCGWIKQVFCLNKAKVQEACCWVNKGCHNLLRLITYLKWWYTIDKRPFTNKLHHFVRKKWHVTYNMRHVTYDMGHMTCDMWHVTHNMWYVGRGWTFFQNFSSIVFWFVIYNTLKIWRNRITDSVNLWQRWLIVEQPGLHRVC